MGLGWAKDNARGLRAGLHGRWKRHAHKIGLRAGGGRGDKRESKGSGGRARGEV